MGLLLSILVFSVGVLEALACVRHIQQGILPAWAPRHVTTPSGRRLLRDRWRKSTSRDEGGEIPVEAAGERPPTPVAAPTRGRPAPLQIHERQGSPALHRARTPDIHWPEPVPHSPVRSVEQTLPSPVEEVPGDLAWPQGDVLAGRRRTSVSETLPPVEHSHAEPLTPGSPVPQAEFATETQEPRRCKPAKASSFEEARVEAAFQAPAPAFPEVTPAPRQPEVISLSYEDYSAAGPRAAVVGRIQITATKESSGEEEPEPWPIVNIDTVATSDDEGDITPPPNSGSRRVSFDPIPTVVSFDREKPVAAEEKLKPPSPAPPIVKVTYDLEDLLREQIPAFVEQIIQEALLKASDVLSLREREESLNGVSLFLKDVITNGVMGNENGEEYKDNFEEYNEEESGVGDNIYQIMEKLQRGENTVDSILPINNKQKQEISQQDTSTTIALMERPENEKVLESHFTSEEERDTFHPNEVHSLQDIETLHSDNLDLEDKYLEFASEAPADFENEKDIKNTYGQNSEVINTTNLSARVPDTNENELEIEEEHILQETNSQQGAERNETEENIQFQIEECQLPNEPALEYNEGEKPENISQETLVEHDIILEETIQPNEQLYTISQQVPEENATSSPTPTSATFESVSSSAPLTTNNGPEEAKEATTLAKQVSPGSQGALDQAQITRAAATAAADSADTHISSDELHEFDIEPGSLASPDVRSAPQPPAEQSAPQPSEELSPAPREEVPSEGRSQDTPSAAATAPPTSPPPSPTPHLALAPTTDKQQPATDSTPSADRNETSRTKENKKKHVLRKRSSKEKRGKRVQTPQASRSPSEDEEEAPDSATVAPVVAPPPPPPREPPPPAPAPPSAEQEPEDSARELTLGTSSSTTSSSSGGAATARPTTPAAAPQPEAFWVRDAPPPPSTPVSAPAAATPFGPSVKKPYRRKEPSQTNMPVSSRFEWPPKPREERPIRPRSAAFSAAAPADPKEHFPPAPPPIPERPPTPVVPEPAPEQTLVSAASAPSPVPDASSPTPGAAAPEQQIANGTAPNGTTPNGTAAAEEADAARDEAASPAPGRFKFEVEMPTTRPTIQPVERDPKEVVRKLTLLKSANPGVASEMLMSILGFHCPH